MPIEVSSEKGADTSAGRGPLGSGRIFFESAECGGLNSGGVLRLDMPCQNPLA